MNEKAILSEYLPGKTVGQIYHWIIKHKIHLKISKSRSTKLGDYRPPIRTTNHRISINHDLNPYAFLITFVHELAHLKVFDKHNRDVLPHGKEWKQEYKSLMQMFLDNNTFPDDINIVLKKSIMNSRASSTSDLALSRALSRYDKPATNSKLEVLETGTIFQTQNGRRFQKGERIRTRYKCLNLQNKRYYLFHPLTPVEAI